MLFSSMLFLWLFLPLTLISYHIINDKYKNHLLLIASLIFYSWGEPKYIVLLILSVLINFISGILIERAESQKAKQLCLFLCVVINLALLGYFKYFDFFTRNINALLGSEIISTRNIVLPIGISFYTFQALSYVIDVYRKQTPVQKNFLNLLLYVSFFPQLIAGPIVKYRDVADQITTRSTDAVKTAFGIKRFVYGLSKKVILSNTFALTVDQIIDIPVSQLSTSSVWLCAVLYSLQIYFDFSGYSDMAIGLGKMFGFDFLENFNYPYNAYSVQDFWRRWHISLSTFFKEYLYIPLGGNRKGNLRTYINLLIVFFCTGLWHGASFNFIAWGLYFGFFLIIERLFLGNWLKKPCLKWFGHIYTLFVVLIGWIMFRANGLRHALQLFKRMFIPTEGTVSCLEFLDFKLIVFLVVGILCAGLIQTIFKKLHKALYDDSKIYIFESFVLFVLLMFSIMLLVNNSYNPFIYFRF